MNPRQIQGELLTRGFRAADVAARVRKLHDVPCSKFLVHRVIRRERATGPVAVLVRQECAAMLGRPVAEVWSEDMECSVAEDSAASAETAMQDSAEEAA